jgi:hypothetical protein
VLDDFFAANVRDTGILSGVAARSALAHEVPILIQLHRDRFEARAVVVGEPAAFAVFEQTMFFLN